MTSPDLTLLPASPRRAFARRLLRYLGTAGVLGLVALAVLRAYVEGVNSGLSALAVKPPEYLVLRTQPRPWSIEDCALVIASMFLTLQDSEARRESRLAAVYATLPAPLADFITTSSSEWETPLVGGPHS